jgi:hypothetical protein
MVNQSRKKYQNQNRNDKLSQQKRNLPYTQLTMIQWILGQDIGLSIRLLFLRTNHPTSAAEIFQMKCIKVSKN